MLSALTSLIGPSGLGADVSQDALLTGFLALVVALAAGGVWSFGKRHSLADRFARAVIVPGFVLVAVLGGVLISVERARETQRAQTIRQQALESHVRELRARVDQAIELVRGLDLLAEAPEDAKRRHALAQLERISFGPEGDGYLFVMTDDRSLRSRGVQVARRLGQGEMGRPVVSAVELAVRGRAGSPEGALVSYRGPCPRTGRPRRKLAFAREVPEWGWLVGAGVYLDAVERDYSARIAAAHRESASLMLGILIIVGSLAIAAVGLGRLGSRRAREELAGFLARVKRAIDAGLPLAPERERYRELRTVTASVNELLTENRDRRLGVEKANAELRAANVCLAEAHAEARRSASEAEQASRAKNEFLATMSHELRTPLHGILGLLDLMRDEPEGMEEHVATARSCALSLLSMVNDVLELSEGSSPSDDLPSNWFSMRGLIEGAISRHRGEAERKGLELSSNVGTGVPPRGYGPEPKIQRLLQILLSNAVRFTDRGRVELSVQPADGGARFTVTDTGIGIPEDLTPGLFDPFARADSSTTRRHAGAGLGLAIARRVAESLGTEIEVESRVGAGSRFSFEVPLRPGPHEGGVDEPARDAEPTEDETSDLCVLVVDDNRVNRRVATAMLKRLGCAAVAVDGGQQALDLLERERFGLVLMDLQMPELDGYATTEMLRNGAAGPQNREVPVLALTASAVESDRVRCFASGMNDFLMKPISSDALGLALRRWTGHPRARGEGALDPVR